MYRQFVKNMDWYLKLNEDSSEHHDYRYNLVKRLEPLKDIEQFKRLKITNIEHYNELQHALWTIKNSIDRYPSFKVFSWELWGYGFDDKYHKIDEDVLEEQLKMIDLLLSTQYWH